MLECILQWFWCTKENFSASCDRVHCWWFRLGLWLTSLVGVWSAVVFLISLYGTPLFQRASYLALHSSLFGPDGTVNYVLIGSRCIPNGIHSNHCRANLAHASKRIKNSGLQLVLLAGVGSVTCIAGFAKIYKIGW